MPTLGPAASTTLRQVARFRHRGPGEEFEHCCDPARRRRVGERGKTIRKPVEVFVIGRGDQVTGAKFGPGVEQRQKSVDVNLRGDLDELDIRHHKPRRPQCGPGCAHHGRLVHQRVAGAVVGDAQQTQAHRVETGLGRGFD